MSHDNAPPEIDKYDTHMTTTNMTPTFWYLTKTATLRKNAQMLYLPRTELSDF